mgnify:CR=1 FL=1
MKAHEAYQLIKNRSKMDLSVKTDEQMFALGYEFRDDEVEELKDIIVALHKQLTLSKKDDKEKPATERPSKPSKALPKSSKSD